VAQRVMVAEVTPNSSDRQDLLKSLRPRLVVRVTFGLVGSHWAPP